MVVKRGGRWAMALGVGALIVAAAGAGGWALATVLQPADDPLTSTAHTTAEVQQGVVGSSLSLNTVAKWTEQQAGTNQAAGVVTGINVHPGDEVSDGDILYRVGERPVAIAEGTVPMYRAIGEGNNGADVAQVQRMLAALGFYGAVADGEAGAMTVEAIKDWQESLGLERTGAVELGDLIFVPVLPTRVTLDSELIDRGLTLVGGEAVVSALPVSPDFTIPVTDRQAAMMPTGTAVQITAPDGGEWLATVGEQEITEHSDIVMRLEPVTGETICGDQCGNIPVTGEARLTSTIVTVPPIEGLVVPSAALVTDAQGAMFVIDADGTPHPVTVLGSARGMSAIDGVEAGMRVRVPATEK